MRGVIFSLYIEWGGGAPVTVTVTSMTDDDDVVAKVLTTPQWTKKRRMERQERFFVFYLTQRCSYFDCDCDHCRWLWSHRNDLLVQWVLITSNQIKLRRRRRRRRVRSRRVRSRVRQLLYVSKIYLCYHLTRRMSFIRQTRIRLIKKETGSTCTVENVPGTDMTRTCYAAGQWVWRSLL